ncbi:A-kinase anchor protein 17A [Thelohanellus kitauei]|uniref:A-kinase anchor protein 17A n=1 Tax=Thelohanellus kitauei TaxID=669202 RepID=A0A0C2MTA9_THEKT|nr:A-kinase anchor protein 17A [Thelohanellus kitauei]
MDDGLVVIHKDLGLFLKPLSKIMITIVLPEKKIVGKMISNWEVMETIKKKIQPDSFLALKVCNSSLIKVLLEAEVMSLEQRAMIIKKLDKNHIKLSGFQDKFIMSAEPAKIKTVKRLDWETFFKGSDFIDSDPGERPDTIHIEDLPVAWFKVPGKRIDEYIRDIFSKFGKITNLVVPLLDPYNDRVNAVIENGYEPESDGFRKTSFLARGLMFDAYVQFESYQSFCDCIETFNGMKMVKVSDEDQHFCNFKFDFDRTKRLSEKVIEEREKIKMNLIENDKIKQAELEAKKTDEQKALEEEKIAQLKQIEEEEAEKLREEQERLKQERLEVEEKLKKDEERYNLLVKDYTSLKKRLESVKKCRQQCAESVLKKSLSKIERELTKPKSRKRKGSHRSSSLKKVPRHY